MLLQQGHQRAHADLVSHRVASCASPTASPTSAAHARALSCPPVWCCGRGMQTQSLGRQQVSSVARVAAAEMEPPSTRVSLPLRRQSAMSAGVRRHARDGMTGYHM